MEGDDLVVVRQKNSSFLRLVRLFFLYVVWITRTKLSETEEEEKSSATPPSIKVILETGSGSDEGML